MRKVIAILSVLIFAFSPACFVCADEMPAYSAEALDEYCYAWNIEYDKAGIDLWGGYGLSTNEDSHYQFMIKYNNDHNNVGYQSDLIPADADLFFLFDPYADIFGFCVFSDNMKSDLEKVVFYTDDSVINDAAIGNSHEEQDMWSIMLTGDQLLNLFSYDQITVRMTVNGKSDFLDISKEETGYIYEMVTWLIRASLYSDTGYETYRSSGLLPDGYSMESNPAPAVSSESAYSFREDYDAIEQSANSVFYVEKYDSKNEYLGSASGFVAFAEHLFVTNQHVIDGAACLKIWDDDGKMYVIDKVVFSDKVLDIAILLFPEGKDYDVLPIDSTAELKRGQPVVTIGSPQGLQNTVAFGNISAFVHEENIDYIQFTAPISHGSSGGCLFNDAGKVIGVTTAGLEEGQNLNFAVPIRFVQGLYEKWDKKSYEALGSERSWDMANIEAASATDNNSESTADSNQLAEEHSASWGTGKSTGIGLSFKEGPGTEYNEICMIVPGEEFDLYGTVLDSKGQAWVEIQFQNMFGYVLCKDISISSYSSGDSYSYGEIKGSTYMRLGPSKCYSIKRQLSAGQPFKVYGVFRDENNDEWALVLVKLLGYGFIMNKFVHR